MLKYYSITFEYFQYNFIEKLDDLRYITLNHLSHLEIKIAENLIQKFNHPDCMLFWIVEQVIYLNIIK